jgi:multidrug efflux pump subunit AcrB
MTDQDYYQSPTPGYGIQTSSLAVVSLISGIASFFIVPMLGAIVAIITGNLAKKEIRQSAGKLTGEDMARWGVILGWVNVALAAIGICIVVLSILGIVGLSLSFIPWGGQ